MADLQALQAHVSQLASQPPFVHAAWFVEHHLTIIRDIVEELLERHPEADATVARAMVWVHDWGKIISNKGPQEDEDTRNAVLKYLPAWGFTQAEIADILETYEEMETLKPLAEDFRIETKIISSADALAHYVGPFFALYWYENPQKSVEQLIADNLRKAKKDENKVLLPEVAEALKPRMAYLLENHPDFRPKQYLS